MKKLRDCAALAVLLALVLALPGARAAGGVYFVAAGEYVLPLSDETMPFWNNGYLYLASSVFAGDVQRALGVGVLPTGSGQTVILSGGGRSLWFEPGVGYARDLEGKRYYPGLVTKGGRTFVPVALVARFFDLQYSTIPVEAGGGSTLVWVRQTGYILSDREFANAAAFRLNACYQDYLALKNPEEADEPEPASPDPEPSGDPEAAGEGKTVRLCLFAGGNLPALLDVLDRRGVQATVFCDRDFLETGGDLVRRMSVKGQFVGVTADSVEELEACNDALQEAVLTRTRLALTDAEDAREAGYFPLEPDLTREGLASGGVEALLSRISSRRGDSVTVYLSGDVTVPALEAFLKGLEAAGGRCAPWLETS